jgi:hypothetical protein
MVEAMPSWWAGTSRGKGPSNSFGVALTEENGNAMHNIFQHQCYMSHNITKKNARPPLSPFPYGFVSFNHLPGSTNQRLDYI